MPFTACPIATIDAPAERVWSLLDDPREYASWWDARTRAIVPDGPARAGQQVRAKASAMGLQWDVHVTVESVDAANRRIDLLTRLPFGITVRTRITCNPLDDAHTRVGFG